MPLLSLIFPPMCCISALNAKGLHNPQGNFTRDRRILPIALLAMGRNSSLISHPDDLETHFLPENGFLPDPLFL